VVIQLLNRLPEHKLSVELPDSVDLREFFLRDPPDQSSLNASTAYACASMIEYFEYRAHGRHAEPSALFLHRVTPRLDPVCNSCCGCLRTTLKAMIRLGMPPEDKWPPVGISDCLEPIDPVYFSYSDDYRPIKYLRLDHTHPHHSGIETLVVVKAFLQAGFPVVFGFPVPGSLSLDPEIEYRPMYDTIRGGQAVVAVGYNDNRRHSAKGSILIRSSWGCEWGDGGYGWLPYSFIENRLARDFWTLLKPDWLETGEFRRPGTRLRRNH
jgi:C1A family cysteine protease